MVLSVSRISSLILLCRSSGILQVTPLVSNVHRSFAWFFPFRATQAYPKSEEKAITKTNNLSAKAGATNVTSNNGYVGGLFGGFHPSSMRVLRKPSISGGMVSSGCRTGWEGAA